MKFNIANRFSGAGGDLESTCVQVLTPVGKAALSSPSPTAERER